jgi:hypothetical protein
MMRVSVVVTRQSIVRWRRGRRHPTRNGSRGIVESLESIGGEPGAASSIRGSGRGAKAANAARQAA